ncbi:MAG: hypothetical protein KDA58_14900, partial [Planctomycetaceae bacterium]|nr:hypothetical protein [Planctomycetaceae bacterium]
ECLMPSKLYGVLAAGVPMIVLAPPECELAQIVERHQLGSVCPPGETLVRDIAGAVRKWRNDRERRIIAGSAARELAEREFDRQIVTGQFGELLNRIHATE